MAGIKTVSALLKKLQDPKLAKLEVYVGTSTGSEIGMNDVTLKVMKKYKVTDEINSKEDGLKNVIVICDKYFESEYDDMTDEEFIKEFE